jgi:hypothetical protein
VVDIFTESAAAPRERQQVGSPADLVNKNDFVSCGPFVYLLLSGMKHAKLQEVKVGASIHLPLDWFEMVDMSLDRSITDLSQSLQTIPCIEMFEQEKHH